MPWPLVKGGEFKGVAFVDLIDMAAFEKALKAHRQKIGGRKINVRRTLDPDGLASVVSRSEAAKRTREEAGWIEDGAGKKRGLTGKDPCYAFQKGECKRGSGCKFSHTMEGEEEKDGGGEDGSTGASQKTATKAAAAKKPKKSKAEPCFAWQKGECTRGKECKFSHSDAPSSSGGGGGSVKKVVWKGVCHAFERGDCKRGNACKFSHNLTGGQDGQEVVVKSKGVCFDFRRGACERGAKCKFSHGGAGAGKDGAASSNDGESEAKPTNWGAKKIKKLRAK